MKILDYMEEYLPKVDYIFLNRTQKSNNEQHYLVFTQRN